jgi:hypothetical protein
MEKSPRIISNTSNRFSDVISNGFTLFFKNYGKLILPLATFQVILIVLDVFLLTDLRWHIDSLGLSISEIMDKFIDDITLTESEWNTFTLFLLLNLAVWFLQNLIGAIIITIAMCSVSNYLFNIYKKREINFSNSFKSAFNKRIFLVILIIGICIPIGSLLFFVPAIIIFGFFIFLVFTYNMQEIEKPILEARRIAKGNFFKIIGIFIFNFVFIAIFSFIYNLIIELLLNPNSDIFIYNYNLWLSPDTRNYGMIILYQILISIIDILLAPLFICLLTALFASLKRRKDFGFDHHAQFRIQEERISQPPQVEDNFYCPFCGHEMKAPKKFCPNCGEKFSFINE